MSKPKLGNRERTILEKYGVIDPPAVPPVEKLADTVKNWGGRFELSTGEQGLALAVVIIGEVRFEAVADETSQALCTATCNAMEAIKNQPGSQMSFLEEEPESGDVVDGEFLAIEAGALPMGDPTEIHGVPDDEPAAEADQNTPAEPTPEPEQPKRRGRKAAAKLAQDTVTNAFVEALEQNQAAPATDVAPDPEAIAAELRANGIPVKHGDDGLYRNPNGDAYPEGWAEQEAQIARSGK